MKTSQKITVVALLVLIRFSAFSQTSMDLGLKINSAPKNRYQLEFRKFFNEKIAFRMALVAGNESYGIQDRMLGANDSMVIVRRGSEFHENYELRAGMESKLGASRFSVGGDLVVSYFETSVGNYTTALPREDFYGSGVIPLTNNVTSVKDQSSSKRYFLGTGVSASLSWEYPFCERFSLNLNVNGTATFLTQVFGRELNDLYNEFSPTEYSMLNFDGGVGMGIRYKIGK